jgi:hypothetical protein
MRDVEDEVEDEEVVESELDPDEGTSILLLPIRSL